MTTEITQEQYDMVAEFLRAYTGEPVTTVTMNYLLGYLDLTVAKPFVPLDVPEVGRWIKAKLQNGKVINSIVTDLETYDEMGYVEFILKGHGYVWIRTRPGAEDDGREVLEWEYVKEWTTKSNQGIWSAYTPEGKWAGTFPTEEAATEYVEAKNNA